MNVTQDLSFALFNENDFLNKSNFSNKIIICPRNYPHGNKKNKYVSKLIDLAKELSAKGYFLKIFGFQDGYDNEVLNEFKNNKINTSVWNPDEMKINNVFQLFHSFDLVVSSRMHAIFVAGMVNTPSIGLGIDPKIEYASNFFSNSVCFDEDFSTREIINEINTQLSKRENSVDRFNRYKNKCISQYEKIKNSLNAH